MPRACLHVTREEVLGEPHARRASGLQTARLDSSRATGAPSIRGSRRSRVPRAMRGAARALTDNFQGAIKDFQFVIEGEEAPEDFKQQAQGWIKTLKKGENPFTEEVLKGMR